MNIKKKFLVLSALCMILTCNFALATDITPTVSGESGEIITSGEIPSTPDAPVSGEIIESGELLPSGEILESGEIDNSFTNVLESTALDSKFTIEVNKVLEGAFEALASGDETFNFVIITEASHGIVSQETSGEPLFSYVPELDYVGEDSFTFRLESGDLYSNVATISITIEGPSEPVIPFYYEDMQSHWANYSASHLAARGMIIGEEINNDFYYYPDKSMTRAEFLLFLLATLDIEDYDITTLSNSSGDSGDVTEIKFADAEKMPDWLLEKVKFAYNMKLISGVSNGNSIYFNPNALITRGEAFVMINNALLVKTNTSNIEGRINFADSTNIPTWARQAIMNLSSYQIIQGDSDNKINTDKITSRGEAAELCYKLLKQLESNALTGSGDLK